MTSGMRGRIVVAVVTLGALGVSIPVAADAVCEGNACKAISQSINAQQKRVFHNSSKSSRDRQGRRHVEWIQILALGPSSSAVCSFDTIRNPYHANYDTKPSPPPRNHPVPPPGHSTFTTYLFTNKSGQTLYPFYSIAGPGTIDCKDLRLGPAFPSNGQLTFVVNSGQTGWFRFQISNADGCDSRITSSNHMGPLMSRSNS